MSFQKQKIEAKIVWIIDVWAYKVRAAITSYKNKDLELIWYGEKRAWFHGSDPNYEDINEINSSTLKQICENIDDGIKKAEQTGNIKVKDIIINIPFQELFFEFNKINYTRHAQDEIDENELKNILEEIKKISLSKAFQNIQNNSSYTKEDLKLIMSNISKIKIDHKETKKLIWENPKEINISILNIFIPENKYQFIKSIENSLWKKIVKIIPSEYSIAKLDYKETDIVIIDIGNSHTSIIVKIDNNIIGMKKISVGMNDLIKEIAKNQSKPKAEIINTIEEQIYLKEKKDFLNTFKDILIITLWDIVWNQICPHYFFMTGGGSNKFVKKFLQESDFNKESLKMVKPISFVSPNIEYLSDIDSSKSNLNIYSMMEGALEFIKREKDPIEDGLKEVMKGL